MTVTEFIDGNFDNIIASLPDGMNGFLKSWGLQKFGETVLIAFLSETGPKIENRDDVNPQDGGELNIHITRKPMPILSDEQIEALAIKHEDFGFGRVDKRGITTHGFNPDGLRAFVLEIIGLCSA